MKLKTKDLTGAALDWAVAKCEGRHIADIEITQVFLTQKSKGGYNYSTDWAQGGPIIERELITLDVATTDYNRVKDKVVQLPRPVWYAVMEAGGDDDDEIVMRGKTPLIAAMRCYVVSKLGDEVDVPEELQ